MKWVTFLRGPRPEKKKDHWEGTVNNIPVKFQAKRTRIARDTAPSCWQLHRDFKETENLFCLKKTVKIDVPTYWKCAVSGCIWRCHDFECFYALLGRSRWLLALFGNFWPFLTLLEPFLTLPGAIYLEPYFAIFGPFCGVILGWFWTIFGSILGHFGSRRIIFWPFLCSLMKV